MATQAIPFSPNQQSGVDSLSSAVVLAVNVVIDGSGAVRKRPGIAMYDEAPVGAVDEDGIQGVYATSTGKVYCVGGGSQRNIYRILNGGSSQLSDETIEKLLGSSRPVFAETEALVVIAGGAAPQKVRIDNDVSSRLGGSPPSSTHLIANTSRLLSNNASVSRGLVNYSGLAAGTSIAGHETWTGGDSGFFSGEARPDPIVALVENSNEVLLLGTTSTQMFVPDADSVYAPVNTFEYGCIAPYSVVKVDNGFVWMDHRRRIVRFDGRAFEVISVPIQQTLNDLSEVSDAYGYRVVNGAVDAVVFAFPTGGVTLAYQVGGGWAEWSGWSEDTGDFERFHVLSHAANPVTGDNLVGMLDGRLGVLRVAADDDLGQPIVARVMTGHLSRGTDAVKHCLAVRMTFRRGTVALGAAEPLAFLSWRDDEGEWSDAHEIGLGAAGDRNPVVQLRGLGTYRRRQWRLEFGEDSDFVLASATEEFELVDD